MWCVFLCVCVYLSIFFFFFLFRKVWILKNHGLAPCIICVIILVRNMCSIIYPSDCAWLFILPMLVPKCPKSVVANCLITLKSCWFWSLRPYSNCTHRIATAHTESAMPWDYVQNLPRMISGPAIFVNPSNIPPWNLPIAWPLKAILGPDQQAFSGGMLKYVEIRLHWPSFEEVVNITL